VQREDEDGRPEAHALGESRDPAEHDQRLEDAREGVPRLRADDDVLRRPHGVEPEVLGCFRHTPDARGRGALAVVREDHSEVHAAIVDARSRD
jgi:hypothetical protein